MKHFALVKKVPQQRNDLMKKKLPNHPTPSSVTYQG